MSQGYLRHFEACNRHDLSRFVPFLIDVQKLGYIEKTLAQKLRQETGFFIERDGDLMLDGRFTDFASRSAALEECTKYIAQVQNAQLRQELYPIIAHWGDKPLAQIDRAAVPWFGVRGFGVHINGFVRKSDGLHLWIGERAMDRQMDPGKLDNLVGGGQPIGLTLAENLCKEAKEEANIKPELAQRAKPVREIRYLAERAGGLRNDTLFIYDLELPPDFCPVNTDGEVAAFHLLPLAEVAAIVRDTDRFKFNCTLVVIDFLLRHGFIGSAEPEYAELKKRLEVGGQRLGEEKL